MRDPSLALGPDGTFHMVWTTSWAATGVWPCQFKGPDPLVEQRHSVMEMIRMQERLGAGTVLRHRQSRMDHLLASTIPGKFKETENSGDNNHRIYCVTTRISRRSARRSFSTTAAST